MATNFGTKIAINAYKYISTRHNENAVTYNWGVFEVEQSKEDIPDCKSLSDVAMATKFFMAKIGKKMTKMAITSVVSDISMQSLVSR